LALDSQLRAFGEWRAGFPTGSQFEQGGHVSNFVPPGGRSNFKPDNTLTRLTGRHKAHFYNMGE